MGCAPSSTAHRDRLQPSSAGRSPAPGSVVQSSAPEGVKLEAVGVDVPENLPAGVPASRSAAPATSKPTDVEAAQDDTAEEGAWTTKGWLTSLPLQQVVANALRASGDSEHQFSYIRTLSRESVASLLQAAGLSGLEQPVWDGICALQKQTAHSSRGLQAKFATEASFEMAYGDLSLFFGGLEGLLGPPKMVDGSLMAAMEREHCSEADATEPFTTPNGATSTSKEEWEFVRCATEGKEYAEREGWREQRPEHCRQVMTEPEMLQLMEAKNAELHAHGHAPLLIEESVAGRLYTGPLYHKYNSVLRAKSGVDVLKRACEKLCGTNSYVTTIHAINSCVLKLSKLMIATKVWRGFTHARLPDSFWEPNKFGVRGGIEYGFSSTSTDKAQAMHYAAGAASTVFEIQMGMVDRGADVSWLSQYPHEKEILFPPLTGLEALGTHVDTSTLVIETRLSLNLVALTLEQVLSKRKKVVIDLCENIKTDFAFALHDATHEPLWDAVNEWCSGLDARGEARRVLFARLDELSGQPAEHYNDDTRLERTVEAAVDVRSAATWSDGFQSLLKVAGFDAETLLAQRKGGFFRSGRMLGNAGLGALATMLRSESGRLTKINDINLSGNDLGDEGIVMFADALCEGALPTLGKMWLCYNRIGNTGFAALVRAFARASAPSAEYTQLNTLDLMGNSISDLSPLTSALQGEQEVFAASVPHAQREGGVLRFRPANCYNLIGNAIPLSQTEELLRLTTVSAPSAPQPAMRLGANDTGLEVELVPATSERRLLLEHADALRAGKPSRLTLSAACLDEEVAAIGAALVIGKAELFGEWQFHWFSLGTAEAAVELSHDPTNGSLEMTGGYVLTAPYFRYESGARAFMLRKDPEQVGTGNKDLPAENIAWVVNADGSLSPANAPHLALGSAHPTKVNSFCGDQFFKEQCHHNHKGLSASDAAMIARDAPEGLTVLNLRENLLGDAGFAHIGTSLRRLSQLSFLDIGRNGIGDAGFAPLIEELKAGLVLPALKEIWLDDNALRGPAIVGLASVPAALPSLEKLLAYSNDLDDSAAEALIACLSDGGWKELSSLVVINNPRMTKEGDVDRALGARKNAT